MTKHRKSVKIGPTWLDRLALAIYRIGGNLSS